MTPEQMNFVVSELEESNELIDNVAEKLDSIHEDISREYVEKLFEHLKNCVLCMELLMTAVERVKIESMPARKSYIDDERILKLKDDEHLSFEAIAKKIAEENPDKQGCSKGTVINRYRKAKQKK